MTMVTVDGGARETARPGAGNNGRWCRGGDDDGGTDDVTAQQIDDDRDAQSDKEDGDSAVRMKGGIWQAGRLSARPTRLGDVNGTADTAVSTTDRGSGSRG
ncbi:hypothetical protein E2562_025236 [Oryza meyeriana var. granulata]|uniref:DUF834 domain-containing protein n=1 Tax=Oryza meyeriana var. granulata TaxID=110450 RepID=A0A6G1BZK3_9ORYZ|nr:hypothetical protein E2562_025236 [Oryza meyeriana var. granulata]